MEIADLQIFRYKPLTTLEWPRAILGIINIQGVRKDVIGKPVQVRRGPATVSRSKVSPRCHSDSSGEGGEIENREVDSACKSGDLPRMMLKCTPAENRSNATVFPKPVFIVQNLASSLAAHLCVDG